MNILKQRLTEERFYGIILSLRLKSEVKLPVGDHPRSTLDDSITEHSIFHIGRF